MRHSRDWRERRRRRVRSVARLTDDLISEILARVPYRSLCRFKCVSRSWLALCSSPSLIRRTLSGFFFAASYAAGHFRFVSTTISTSSSGSSRRSRFPLMEGPLFSFLPRRTSSEIRIIDSCNGLLLLDRQHHYRWNEQSSRYLVCNPATGNWMDLDLPDPMEGEGGRPMWRLLFPELLRLGFDPADDESPHFRVFWVLRPSNGVRSRTPQKIAGVRIYSSETRSWTAHTTQTQQKSGWGTDILMRFDDDRARRTAFFHGALHLATASSSIVTVDRDGKTWRTMPTPRSFGFIGVSRGCLYAVEELEGTGRSNPQLSIWALRQDDYHDGGRDQWILKHTATPFGHEENAKSSSSYVVVRAIHPEDPLFFVTTNSRVGTGTRTALVSYDFMNGRVQTIKSLGQSFENDFPGQDVKTLPYPYIPCFSKWSLSDGH